VVEAILKATEKRKTLMIMHCGSLGLNGMQLGRREDGEAPRYSRDV